MKANQSELKPAVLIVARDNETFALGDSLWGAGIDSATVASWVEARRMLDRVHIPMAIIDGDLPQADLQGAISELPQADVKAVLWLVTNDRERDEHLRLPRGCEGWQRISKPLWPEELYRRVSGASALGDPLPASMLTSRSTARSARPPGQVMAVFSNKGGVGKSMVAVNLAIGLQRLYGDSVLLVDADLYYGDIEPLLDIRCATSIRDVCSRQVYEPASLVALTNPHPTGIRVLPRPHELSRVEMLDTAILVNALTVYATAFDHVVVNLATAPDEFNLSILEAADRVLLVLTPELPAALNTARFIQVATNLNLAAKTAVVLNRADGPSSEAIASHLGLQVMARLPNSGKLVARAANEGKSLFEIDPHHGHEMTRAMVSLVELVAGRRRRSTNRNPLARVFGRTA